MKILSAAGYTINTGTTDACQSCCLMETSAGVRSTIAPHNVFPHGSVAQLCSSYKLTTIVTLLW